MKLSKLRHKLNQPELIGFSSVDLERWGLSRGQILHDQRRTLAVGAFPDGKPAVMLRHVVGTKWGTRRYLDINRLAEACEAA